MKYLALPLILLMFMLPMTVFAETQFYYFDNDHGEGSFDDHYEDVDVISPQVYEFGNDFKLHKKDDNGVIRKAKREDVKIVPLVVQEGFNQVLISLLIHDEDMQEAFLDDLVDEAQDEDYAGWQFDFENIAAVDRDGYTEFVENASRVFKDHDLEFSVAVVPRTQEYIPYSDLSDAYDYAKLGRAADYLVAMAYDDGHSLGPSGSLIYQRDVLNYMLTKVPAEKLQLGVPLYCWKWGLSGGYRRFGSLSHNDTDEDIDDSKLLVHGYIDALGSEYDAYIVPSGNLYITWCDGVKGFEAKQDLAREYHLRGTSMWAIGQEDEGIWRTLR